MIPGDLDYEKALKRIWELQIKYNRRARDEEYLGENITEEWTKQYLLGLVSEIDEVLGAIQWKKHRRRNKVLADRRNLGFELVDLTKYVLSLWEVNGYSLEDILIMTEQKTKILEYQWAMEHAVPPVGKKIVIADIDGTLGDWRKSFVLWMEEVKGVKAPVEDGRSTMFLDADLQMKYPEYYRLKEEFEATQGYANLIPYPDAIEKLRELYLRLNVYVIVYTARPAVKYRQIWWDTWTWLGEHGIHPDILEIGHEPRILAADRLRLYNEVIMLEDDPGIMLRAARMGIKVFARRQHYNEGISDPNITFLDDYRDLEYILYFGGS